jgi:hypothetical protein
MLQQAIAKEPAHGLAYAGLADCYRLLANSGFVGPNEAYPRSQGPALKALEVNDTLAQAHNSVGSIKATYLLYKDGAKSGRVMAICLHPFLIGHPHRSKCFAQNAACEL